MIEKLLLDMDGPLVNLRDPLCELHNLPDPYTESKQYPFELTDVWPLTINQLWVGCDADWWANLPPQPWMEELVYELELRFGKKNICLLTSPLDDDGSCYMGKMRWIKQHLPQYRRRFLVGPAKEFAAGGPHKGLVDDRPKNLKDFEAAGGTALAFPTPWNVNYRFADDPMPIVRTWLDTIAT